MFIYTAAAALSVYIKGESRWARAQLEWIRWERRRKKRRFCLRIYINVRLQGRREVARQRSAGSSFLPPSMKREGSCPAVALYLHKLHRVYNSQVRLGASPLAVCSHPNFQGNFLLLFSGRFGEGWWKEETKKKCWHHQEDEEENKGNEKEKRAQERKEPWLNLIPVPNIWTTWVQRSAPHGVQPIAGRRWRSKRVFFTLVWWIDPHPYGRLTERSCCLDSRAHRSRRPASFSSRRLKIKKKESCAFQYDGEGSKKPFRSAPISRRAHRSPSTNRTMIVPPTPGASLRRNSSP